MRRYKPGENCCNACLRFKDEFNRADEEINGLDSTGNWNCLPNLSPSDHAWEIEDFTSTLDLVAYQDTGPFRAFWVPDVPRHVSCRVDFKSLQANSKVNITYQMIVPAEDEPASKRYRVQVEVSDQTATEAHNSGEYHCGFISLWDVTDLDVPVQLGWDVPIPALYRDYWHTLNFCYDPDSQLLSASVTVTSEVEAFTGTYYIHAKNCAGPSDPLEQSQIWLEVTDIDTSSGSLPYARFDKFRVSQTKDISPGYDYYYYDLVDDCPCCGNGGCSVTSDDFEDGEIDCRWYQTSGSWSEADGKISATAGVLTWLGSWSGINDDCEPDCSAKAWVEVHAPEDAYGTRVWTIHVDKLNNNNYHMGKLSLVADDQGVSTGTLKLFRVEDSVETELASEDVGPYQPGEVIKFAVCIMYDDLTAVAKGTGDVVCVSYSLSGAGEGGYDYGDADTGPFCGPFVAIGLPNSPGGEFYYFEVSHNLDSEKCDDCFGDQDGSGGSGPTCGGAGNQGTYQVPGGPGDCDEPEDPLHHCLHGIYPLAIKATVTFDTDPTPPGDCCPEVERDVEGTHILHIFKVDGVPQILKTIREACMSGGDWTNLDYEDQLYCCANWSTPFLEVGPCFIGGDFVPSGILCSISSTLFRDESGLRIIGQLWFFDPFGGGGGGGDSACDLGFGRSYSSVISLGPIDCVHDFSATVNIPNTCLCWDSSQQAGYICGISNIKIKFSNI